MDDNNDRLVTEKPEPMKKMDWILFGILILLLLVTFPVLFRVYRFMIPLALLGLLAYFGVKIFQLGKSSGNNPEKGTTDFTTLWYQMMNLFITKIRAIAITGIIMIVLSVGLILLFNNYSKAELTEKRMDKMAQALEKYKSHLGNYPSGLSDLIGTDPIRREWYQDAWGNAMTYNLSKEGSYKLVSAGPDGKSITNDDLVREK